MATSVCRPARIGLEPVSTRIDSFRTDVVAGLQSVPKSLPCKYLYDRRGSQLFDAICQLPEYYLTRTELHITADYAEEIADEIGPRATLIELGSGSSVKTRILLDHLHIPLAYVPVDISSEYSSQIAAKLAVDYPHLKIVPKHADFTGKWELPTSINPSSRRIAYFPGSTIGNFHPRDARALLNRLNHLVGDCGGLVIGIDLQKDRSTIEAAYNDAQGVTAEFSLNLLRRINRELAGNLDLEAFHHKAFYDSLNNRVDIRLVSQKQQHANIAGHRFNFEQHESIQTEYSYKYTIAEFSRLAAQAGFTLKRAWTDARQYFAVLFLVRRERISSNASSVEDSI